MGAALGLSLPGLGFAASGTTPSAPDWDRRLILVELDGGNDGLNTVVPYVDDVYYRSRPTLGIPSGNLIPLSDNHHGLHPALAPLRPVWDAGQLAIVHGTGYDNPNRSHFRGIDIWNTGSSSDVFLDDGWIGRALAATTRPADVVADGVILRRAGSNPIEHAQTGPISMSSPADFVRLTDGIGTPPGLTGNPSLDHILSVQGDVVAAAGSIATAVDNPPVFLTEFPDHQLGNQFRHAATLIASGLRFPVFKLSRGGFDTHASQAGRHDELLDELASGLAAFRSAMMEHGWWDRCLVMTYAEFGRRLKENGSRGTDHGAAAIQFAAGGCVQGGFHGAIPSLAEDDLFRGDPVYTTDYRSYYGSCLNFMGLDPATALGPGFTPVPFV
jgi:uncharacterized protein (DUF1501 family)